MASFGDRLVTALKVTGRTCEQLDALAGLPAGRTRLLIPAGFAAHADVVAIAEALAIDARWLATGKCSPSAAAVLMHIELFEARSSSPTSGLVRDLRNRWMDLIELAPEPELTRGVCRYCMRRPTKEAGEWHHPAGTICSPCLDPPEHAGAGDEEEVWEPSEDLTDADE